MSNLPFIPLYGRDFRSDTEHLRAREVGAYLLLIMHAWEQPKCRLPDDDAVLAWWARVDPRTWSKIKPKILAFWTLKGGYWTQTRLRCEWDKANTRMAAAKANGKRGGRPKSRKAAETDNPGVSGLVRGTKPAPKLITSTSTEEDQDRGLLETDKKSTPAQPARFVSEAALDAVRSIAPGWDRQMLLSKFLAWPGSKNAYSMDAAFKAWAKSYTKGKAPGYQSNPEKGEPQRYGEITARTFLNKAAARE